jgi:hypothetical protein
VSEQPDLSTLLCEAAELLGEASDKLTAAQLLEQERGEKLRERFRDVVQSVAKLSDLLQELVP